VHLTYNQKELIILLHNSLKTKKYIGCYNDNFITKLQMLQIAQQADLYTPFTAIVSNKKQLADFIEKHQTIITKGIKSNSFNINSYTPVTSLTQIIKKNDFDLFPYQFAPSIVQKYIDKLFELRVFYLAENCYTAAIFSQKDEKTKVDFRNYNSEKPNRIIPYKLPYDIEQRLIKLMNSLKMKSGSIDIIVSTQLEYFFLEVNPVGQFEWISKNCNFYLEKIIANYFKQNTHESKSYSIS
jgi:ATP-GRASP peptide maturase of grasp-with-spasm system